MVVTETAATLSVLLFLFACYLVVLCRIGSSRRRPLRLNNDPATTFSAGAYMQRHPRIHQLLHKTQISSTHDGESGLMDSTEYKGYQSDKTPLSINWTCASSMQGSHLNRYLPLCSRLACLCGGMLWTKSCVRCSHSFQCQTQQLMPSVELVYLTRPLTGSGHRSELLETAIGY